MTVGMNDLKNIALPSAWDAAELQRLQLRDGTTYAALIQDINDALQLATQALQNGYMANLFSLTTEAAVEYRIGVSNGYEDHTEYAQPDAQRGETSGHMLPISKKDRKLGWTQDFLEESRRTKIDADIMSLIDDTKDAFEKAVLTRLFKMEEETGKRYGLGSSGYSVPFADGGGGTIAFTPIAVSARGGTFAASHDHYSYKNGITQANLNLAVKDLWEHGFDGPYELIVSLADLGSWQTVANVTGYKEKPDPSVVYGISTSLANVSEDYTGGVTTPYGFCRLHATGRVPTKMWCVTKSWGKNDPRNPLMVRYDELYGFGPKLMVENVSLYPLQGAIAVMKFGVGVNDRVQAVLVENDSSGDYTTPTIS